MDSKDFITIKYPYQGREAYPIEHNVPIPPYKARTSGKKPFSKTAYPFEKMEVGDSFLVSDRSYIATHGSVSAYKRSNPPKNFTVRRVDGGIRVWRVPDIRSDLLTA